MNIDTVATKKVAPLSDSMKTVVSLSAEALFIGQLFDDMEGHERAFFWDVMQVGFMHHQGILLHLVRSLVDYNSVLEVPDSHEDFILHGESFISRFEQIHGDICTIEDIRTLLPIALKMWRLDYPKEEAFTEAYVPPHLRRYNVIEFSKLVECYPRRVYELVDTGILKPLEGYDEEMFDHDAVGAYFEHLNTPKQKEN